MKRIISYIAVIFIICSVFSCQQKLGPGVDTQNKDASSKKTAIVTAATNLVIRTKPERTATKLGVAGHGATVEILEVGTVDSEIDGISAKWYRIDYQGVVGWVFGGYLDTGEKPDTVLTEQKTAKAYIGKKYTKFSPVLESARLSAEKAKNNDIYSVIQNNHSLVQKEKRYIVLISGELEKRDGVTVHIVKDALEIQCDANETLLWGDLCKGDGISDPLIAVTEGKPDKDCVFSMVNRAWTVTDGYFSPAMLDGITCKLGADACDLLGKM